MNNSKEDSLENTLPSGRGPSLKDEWDFYRAMIDSQIEMEAHPSTREHMYWLRDNFMTDYREVRQQHSALAALAVASITTFATDLAVTLQRALYNIFPNYEQARKDEMMNAVIAEKARRDNI